MACRSDSRTRPASRSRCCTDRGVNDRGSKSDGWLDGCGGVADRRRRDPLDARRSRRRLHQSFRLMDVVARPARDRAGSARGSADDLERGAERPVARRAPGGRSLLAGRHRGSRLRHDRGSGRRALRGAAFQRAAGARQRRGDAGAQIRRDRGGSVRRFDRVADRGPGVGPARRGTPQRQPGVGVAGDRRRARLRVLRLPRRLRAVARRHGRVAARPRRHAHQAQARRGELARPSRRRARRQLGPRGAVVRRLPGRGERRGALAEPARRGDVVVVAGGLPGRRATAGDRQRDRSRPRIRPGVGRRGMGMRRAVAQRGGVADRSR